MPAKLSPAIAKVTGAAKRHPERYDVEVITVDQPVGQAPMHMTAAGKRIWEEVVSLYPPQVLRIADRHAVEILCEEMAAYRADPAGFPNARLTSLINLVGRLGGTPQDRVRLALPKDKEKAKADPFADF
jgi:phage terminase small subunit